MLRPILAKKEEKGQWQEKAQQYNKERRKKNYKVRKPQRKQTGPKEPKEGSSKSMRIIRNEKQAKWVGGAQRKELVNGVDVKANKPPKVKDMVIGPKKPKRCVAKAHKNVKM